MRINVYAEELTTEAEVITKTVVPDGQTEPVTFYGVRFYLVSPDALHQGPDDDDRSGITLWVKWTKLRGNDFNPLLDLADQVHLAILAARRQDLRTTP